MAPIGMAITDLNGKLKKVNQSLCKALGYSQAELLNKTFSDRDCPSRRLGVTT
ncbi:PAS domain S-box protein [Myxosarcina sp. GI1(2024)]